MTATEPVPATRERVVQAALDTICEVGYYRASSNEIARRANVSWGVIQHYFGNREQLMFAAFADACERATEKWAQATIQGDTVEERLRSLQNVIYEFCGNKQYTAIQQIIWNLISDPDTSDELAAALRPVSDGLEAQFRRLAQQVSPDVTPEFVDLTRRVTWGLAVQNASRQYLHGLPTSSTKRTDTRMRNLLSHALASLVDDPDGATD